VLSISARTPVDFTIFSQLQQQPDGIILQATFFKSK